MGDQILSLIGSNPTLEIGRPLLLNVGGPPKTATEQIFKVKLDSVVIVVAADDD